MKRIPLSLSVLVLAAALAGARGREEGERGSSRRGSARGQFSRPLSRPKFAGAKSSGAAVSHAKSRSAVANFSKIKKAVPGGGTGSPTPAPAPTDTPPPYATPGAKIVTAGQPPGYSNPGNGGTHSVDGGGFIAIDQGRANDVGRGGITWGTPDRVPSSGGAGGGGSGASENPGF